MFTEQRPDDKSKYGVRRPVHQDLEAGRGQYLPGGIVVGMEPSVEHSGQLGHLGGGGQVGLAGFVTKPSISRESKEGF